MYYQNYEDYMRSILGYPTNNQDTYRQMNDDYMEMMTQNTNELEEMYPDIFKALNPTITEMCSKCNGKVTREVLEDMVEDVFSRIDNNEININISLINDSNITSNSQKEAENRSATLQNNTSNSQIPQRSNYNRNITQNAEQLKRSIEPQENREINRETRQRRPNNPLLRDIIKILLLNQLINRPSRPNMPMPPRPPFPGEPRPPMPPRPGYRGDFDDYLRF